MSIEAVACPGCFRNYGFRQVVLALCRPMEGPCPRCGSFDDLKVDLEGLKLATRNFFVSGSYISETSAPVYQVNETNQDSAPFDLTLQSDVELVGRLTKLTVFQYAPQLWRLGMTTHYHDFQAGGERRRRMAERLVEAANSVVVSEEALLFRIRLNLKADELKRITSAATFDPPRLQQPSGEHRGDGTI